MADLESVRTLLQFVYDETPSLMRLIPYAVLHEVVSRVYPSVYPAYSGINIGIVPGWPSISKHPYLVIQEHFARQGHRTLITHKGQNIWRKYTETVTLTERMLDTAFPGERFSLIGHSYGGVIAAFVAVGKLRERVKMIVALGTAFTGGAAVQIVKKRVYAWTGVSEQLFAEHHGDIMSIADKLIIVASRYDTLAPYKHCVVPCDGVHHIDVSSIVPDVKIGHHDLITHPAILQYLNQFVG